MADTSLSDRACTINLSVKQSTLDNLTETIAKASALIQVTLCGDFSGLTHRIQYDYLWALSDFIDQAQQLCDQFETHPENKLYDDDHKASL